MSALDGLRRKQSEREWAETVAACRSHPLFGLLQQDPYASRSYTKPRGYPGDAVLLDYIYGLSGPPERTTAIGKAVFSVSMRRPGAASVRWRREFLAREIDRIARAFPARARILSIACGHLREAELARSFREDGAISLIGVDQDAETVSTVNERNAGRPVRGLQASAKELLLGALGLGRFSYVYSAGLSDYLDDKGCARLVRGMFEMLEPQGELLLANFTPETQERGYMEAIMDWRLTYRAATDLARLTARLPASGISRSETFADPLGNIVFLRVVRAG